MKKQLILCVLSLLLITSCFAMPHGRPLQDPATTPLVISDYISKCIAARNPCMEDVSFPFYADDNPLSPDEYYQEFSRAFPASQARPIPNFEMDYLLLPMSDLKVFWPKIYQSLMKQEAYLKEKDNLALVAVTVHIENQYEKAWLILRRTDPQKHPPQWQVAGIIDG